MNITVNYPLEWEERSRGPHLASDWTASTPFGGYTIEFRYVGYQSGKWRMIRWFDNDDDDATVVTNVDAGKALAQADWNERMSRVKTEIVIS